MLSAHGSAPDVVAAARARGSYVVDSVCPLVTKVHHEVRVRSGKGYRIVYVGHEGHEEAVGTMAVAPDAISRVESVAEVEALEQFTEPVALLAQTTLSHRDWNDVAVAVKQRYPDAWTPGRSDLCFATTNRQSALMELAARCGAIVVIGSANSSNTRALEKLAREAGCDRVARVNTAAEIPAEFFDPSLVVGVTAGASAPNEVVEQVISTLAPRNGVELVRVTEEDEYFPPPRKLRDLQAAIEVAATAMLGGAPAGATRMDDRSLSASTVLAALASGPCLIRRVARRDLTIFGRDRRPRWLHPPRHEHARGVAAPLAHRASPSAAGWTTSRVGDHVSFVVGAGFDGLLGAAGILSVAERMSANTAVYLLPLRHPVTVARQLADIAALAPGRFVFGVGIGGEDPHEVEICGVDPRTRGRRMDEALQIVRQLLTGATGRLRGAHFTLAARADRPGSVGTDSDRRRRPLGRGAAARRPARRRLVRHLGVRRPLRQGGRGDGSCRRGRRTCRTVLAQRAQRVGRRRR